MVEGLCVDTVWDDGDFFGCDADMPDIEIFDGFRIGEIAPRERFGQSFEEASDLVAGVIIRCSEEWDDGGLGGAAEGEATEHVRMEEVGDDDVGILFTNSLSETVDTRET